MKKMQVRSACSLLAVVGLLSLATSASAGCCNGGSCGGQQFNQELCSQANAQVCTTPAVEQPLLAPTTCRRAEQGTRAFRPLRRMGKALRTVFGRCCRR